MLIDNLLSFTSTNTAITSATVNSTVIDFLGVGSGVASTNIIGNVTTFGADMGIGKWKQQIEIILGTAAWVGGTSLQIALQLANDNGANSPGTWQTIEEGPVFTTAQLLANLVIKMDWPPQYPATTRYRFARLQYVPIGTFSAGSILSALITTGRPDFQSMLNAAANYVAI